MAKQNINYGLPGVDRSGSVWHPSNDRIYVFEYGQPIKCPYCGKLIPKNHIDYYESTDVKEVLSGYCDRCRVDFDFDIMLPKKKAPVKKVATKKKTPAKKTTRRL